MENCFVSCRACLHVGGLYGYSHRGDDFKADAFSFPFLMFLEAFPFPLPSKVLSIFSWLYRYFFHDSPYVPNHGDLFCHLIDQIISLILAVKDSLRILRDSLRSLRTP